MFLDQETFEQITIPEELVGNGKWLITESEEYPIRFVDGKPVNIMFPPNFLDEIVDTADPTSAGRGTSVGKDAKLKCGLTIKVPMFIKVGELVKVDTESHEYMGKASEKK